MEYWREVFVGMLDPNQGGDRGMLEGSVCGNVGSELRR